MIAHQRRLFAGVVLVNQNCAHWVKNPKNDPKLQIFVIKKINKQSSVAQWLACLIAMPEVSGSNLTQLQDFHQKISTLSRK